MKAKAQVVDGLLHLRYGVPYRINTSQVYPLLAPNGSTVIVCGHDQGVLVVWRGGRPFKSGLRINSDHQELDGAKQKHEMSIDVDEGISRSATDASMIDMSLFEDEEEEVTLAKPYHPIVQDLNLPLGTATLHIAFPRIEHASQDLPNDMSPKMLGHSIVIAVACADSIIRLLTLPLVPPSPHTKNRLGLRDTNLIANVGRGSWGESILNIPRTAGNQGLPKAISIAFIPRQALGEAEDSTEEGEDGVIDHDEDKSYVVNGEWDILLVSCGSDPSGEILMYKIPLSGDGTCIESNAWDDDFLWRSEPVVRRVAALEIYVPARLSTHEGPYLLLAETNGAVRVFDCCFWSDRSRGQWVRWFYPGFEDNGQGGVRYRTLIDAKWILGGRAIAALMADGEWGAWNTNLNTESGVGQSEKRSSYSPVIPTGFNISGWVGGFSSVNTSAKSSTGKADSRSKLAPMTPSTRKMRESALFTGVITRSSISSQGGISTCVIPKALSSKDDETLVFWHGDNIVMIPSLLTHWESKIRGSGNLFRPGATGQAREVSTIGLGGELRNAVSILPLQAGYLHSQKSTKQPDLLVSGDRSLLVIATPLHESGAPRTYFRDAPPPSLADERHLSRGELDVNGMDRILDSMEATLHVNGDQAKATAVERKVVFAK
ncbi:hypothetical protein MMC18_004529 [Xylographa bjoerkii]|nr:hypothetical protein [Xylographa bjoerkii]